MNAPQAFERILRLQYRLDCAPPEESAELFVQLDEAIDTMRSLTGLETDAIWEAVNERYEAFVRKHYQK